MAALMIQGCGFDVGKSVLVAGLCRLYANRGLTVRPFKPQNMSNSAAVTMDGGEIGRAQALQAIACRTQATVDMNPVLLKPQSDVGAQVIVRGQMQGSWKARGYQDRKAALLPVALESFARLQEEADLVLVEGGDSPAEINLRAGDIANMGFARAAKVRVALVGDIDRGHVIAALVGAHAVLDEDDRAMAGFIINRFRGDPSLFTDGRIEIVRRTGRPNRGIAPWLVVALRLPAEAAVVLQDLASSQGARRRIAAPLFCSISNFDDFDPLRAEPDIDFASVPPGTPLPTDADLIILPGSKTTRGDLAQMRREGWHIDLLAHVRRGGRVLGVCGGFQMLGRRIADPEGIDGDPGEAPGLGLLDVETVLTDDKALRPVAGGLAEGGAAFTGYEIYVGRASGPGLSRPLLRFEDGVADSAISTDGRVMGCYVHGLFDTVMLTPLGVQVSREDQAARVDSALDEVAAMLEASLDIPALGRIAGLPV